MTATKNKKKTPASKKPSGSTAAGKNSPPALAAPRSRSGVKKSPAARVRPAAPRTNIREKLSVLKPSGGKEDSFFDLVHEVARQIPRGRVTSYGAIAACLGTRLSARMVGWAMNACHNAKKPVPAHRVVNSKGLLTGKHHFSPPSQMERSLKKEGVKVKDDKVVDFAKIFWDPASELG